MLFRSQFGEPCFVFLDSISGDLVSLKFLLKLADDFTETFEGSDHFELVFDSQSIPLPLP